MFEGLKKKFSNFIGGLAKKEKEEVKEAGRTAEAVKEEPIQEEAVEEEKQPESESKKPEVIVKEETTEHQKQPEEKPKPVQYQSPSHGIKTSTIPQNKYSTGTPVIQQKPKPVEELRPHQEPKPQVQQPKVTFTTKLKSVIFSKVKISEKDADPFIETLKIELLQSDVNYDVAEKMAASIRSGLVGKAVDSKNIEREITESIRGSIMSVLSSRTNTDLVSMVNQARDAGTLPFKIMFIGPNGAGKTTTMAKIANMLLANNITCVLSASDTFRAAAIEQTVYHAGKLGINVIKGNYGSDPASVAFDAIAHAKAHGIMTVLIDSAGRQETNKSLDRGTKEDDKSNYAEI